MTSNLAHKKNYAFEVQLKKYTTHFLVRERRRDRRETASVHVTKK
jgi:hypothetical protein